MDNADVRLVPWSTSAMPLVARAATARLLRGRHMSDSALDICTGHGAARLRRFPPLLLLFLALSRSPRPGKRASCFRCRRCFARADTFAMRTTTIVAIVHATMLPTIRVAPFIGQGYSEARLRVWFSYNAETGMFTDRDQQ